MDPWILERMRSFGDAPALAWNGELTTYRALVERVEGWTRTLETEPGQSVAFVGDYSPNAAALLLALALKGNVAVPLTRRAAADRERNLDLAEVELVIELDADDRATQTRRSVARKAPLLAELRARGEPGLVVFSSGSTGESKAILHSFERALEKYREPRPPMRSLVFLLLDHLGGINTLLNILLGGGLAVSISQRSPDAICAAIARWRVELLPTSPTFLNMLLMSGAHRRHDLSSLRLITYGTECMPEATLAALTRELPDVKLKQTYGMSELGALPTRSESKGSLRLKVGGPGVEARVVDGTLRVRTRQAMLGYLNLPSPIDAEGWFDTGDAVETDGEWIRFLGRKTELINVGGEKVTPTEVESTILELDNVLDVAVRGKANAVTGQVVAARVTLRSPEDPDALRARIRAHCAARLARYKVPMVVEIDDAGPGERIKRARREA